MKKLTVALVLALICLAGTVYWTLETKTASANRERELTDRNRELSDRLYFAEKSQRQTDQLSRLRTSEVPLPKTIPLLGNRQSIEEIISNGESAISFPNLTLITPPLPPEAKPKID